MTTTYQAPYGIQISGYYQGLSGAPQQRTYVFRAVPSLGTVTINMEPFGASQLPSLHSFNFRIGKRMSIQKYRLQVQADIYNLTNTNTVTGLTVASGPALRSSDVVHAAARSAVRCDVVVLRLTLGDGGACSQDFAAAPYFDTESMPTTAVESYTWEQPRETVAHAGITRRICQTERLTIVRYEFAAGAVFPSHAHREWQVTMVESGIMTFDFGDRIEHYKPADIISIPGGVAHQGRAEHGPVTIMCVFTPPRR